MRIKRAQISIKEKDLETIKKNKLIFEIKTGKKFRGLGAYLLFISEQVSKW